MLSQVRVKGIINDLISATNVDSMPIPLIIFINNLCQQKSYVPNNFLTKWQLNRIDTDNYGAIIDLDHMQLKMISSIYIFGRIMLTNIFLQVKNNKDSGQTNEQRINDVVEENFKVIASILYYLFMQVMK